MSEAVLLAQCDPAFRSRLVAVLGVMRARGHQPVVIDTWRTLTKQAELYAQGASKVTFSFHNAVDDQARPAALAADLYDARWNSFDDEDRAEFYADLGTIAKAHGMSWGGDWARTDPQWAAWGLGWDPGHIQAYPNRELEGVKARSLAALHGTRSNAASSGVAPALFGAFLFGLAAVGFVVVAGRR